MALESLSYSFGSDFSLEVDSPHIAELDLSVRVEAVVTAIEGMTMIAWSSVQHVGVVRVLCKESLAEFVEVKSAIVANIVPFEEKVCLF